MFYLHSSLDVAYRISMGIYKLFNLASLPKNDLTLVLYYSMSICTNDGWMDELGFYIPSTVFQSFRDDGRVNMKGSVQWSAV